jgi:hypothetical protein
MTMTTGFSNKSPRRGTRPDVAMRKHALKQQRQRLPRTRDFERLQMQAEMDMHMSAASFGVCRGRRAS